MVVYRAMHGRASLFFFPLLFFVSFIRAQPTGLYAGLVENGSTWYWSVDLSDLEKDEELVIYMDDSAFFQSLREIPGVQLQPLFAYAGPRFIEKTDTFDCYTRELLAADNPDQDTVKEVGLPGRRMRDPGPSRGMEEGLVFTGTWKKGGYAVSIKLSDLVGKSHRTVRFSSNVNVYPRFERIKGVDTTHPALHLFALGDERRLAPAGPCGFMPDSLVLPLEINTKRKQFMDAWMEEMEAAEFPSVLYAWDIGAAGGNKCDPCVSEPPSNSLLVKLGADPMAEHRYFTYQVIPMNIQWKIEEVVPGNAQVLFEFHHRSKGFLNCPMAADYLRQIQAKRQLEVENLKILIGGKALSLLEGDK